MDNSTLKAHLFEQHCITSFYACALCPTMFLNHTSLEKHLRQDHDLPSPVSCESCDNIFQNEEEMDRHINLCHASSNTCCDSIEDATTQYDGPIRCSFCDYTFTSMRALNVHTAYRHTLKLHSLSDSTTGSTSPPPILPHITCSTCDVKFRANKHLKEHNALKHDKSDISTCKVVRLLSQVHKQMSSISMNMIIRSTTKKLQTQS